MSRQLDPLKKTIAQELVTFEKHFKDNLKSNTPLLDRITHYIVKRKGKQIRPMFVFLSAKLSGESSDRSYTAASMIEILHTATLVHDDVVDDSDRRRGFFSINALWKNKIAVLVGDYLFSKGLLVAIDNGELKMLQIISRAIRDMSEGELLQIEKARTMDIKEDVYYEIIRKKTASLIGAACALGRSSATDDDDEIEKMRLFGEKIGMAFQIKDDLFDYGKDDVGKPRGIDIKEKKLTLPLIHVLNKADKKRKRQIINTVKRYNDDKKKVNELIQYVREHEGLNYASDVMHRYKDEALMILQDFDDTPVRQSLIDLVNYVIDREK